MHPRNVVLVWLAAACGGGTMRVSPGESGNDTPVPWRRSLRALPIQPCSHHRLIQLPLPNQSRTRLALSRATRPTVPTRTPPISRSAAWESGATLESGKPGGWSFRKPIRGRSSGLSWV